MRSEVRVVVALGLAVAVWLLLVPTASAVLGSSCGVPVVSTDVQATVDDGLAPDCAAQNQTRVKQGVATAVGAAAVLAIAAAWQAITNRAPGPPPGTNPRSYYEDL